MFEAFEAIGAAWHTVEFVAEWSGVSVGVILALGALFYFDPLARRFAVASAVLVVIAWACLMHGHIEGAKDEAAKLQTISDQNDKRAAASASADESALVAAIEAKAKEQHEQDLAEIERVKASGADCTFDPDGGVQPNGDAVQGEPRAHAKPAGVAKAARKSAAGAAPHENLFLSLVRGHWLQGSGRKGDAAPNGQ